MGLALANFGRDPRNSDSLRGIFFLKRRKNCSEVPGLATNPSQFRNDYRSPEIHFQMVRLRDV